MIPNKFYSLLNDYLPMIVLFVLVMISTRIVYVLYGKKDISVFNELKGLVYILYIFLLFILVTTSDFSGMYNNFVPFKEIFRYKFNSPLFYRNVIGNIILFIPFGFIIADMIYENCRKCNIFIVSLITIFISTATEYIQLTIGRSFDVDDILLNFVGGIIGYLLFKIVNNLYNKIKDTKLLYVLKFLSIFIFILIFGIVLFVAYGVI